MENKIAISAFASRLSLLTGKSKKLCDDFLREFFKVVTESLEAGEILKIKGLGTFKVTEVDGRSGVNVTTGAPQEIAPYKKVVFTPAKDLASVINAPFEAFESVEIEDDMPDFMILDEEVEEPETEEPVKKEQVDIEDRRTKESAEEKEGTQSDDINVTTVDTDSNEEKESPEERGPQEDEPQSSEVSDDENQVEEGVILAGSDEESDDDEITLEAYSMEDSASYNSETEKVFAFDGGTVPDTPLPVYEYDQPAKSRFGTGFLFGALTSLLVCVIIFMLGCFFDWWPVNFGKFKAATVQVANSEINPAPEEETVNVVEDMPEPVYDTVTKTRYLTTIAREHYGNFNLWPYIYIENQSILGHPDRITPGTKVVVPDLKKYGVNPEKPEDIEIAKKKGIEIYSKYK